MLSIISVTFLLSSLACSVNAQYNYPYRNNRRIHGGVIGGIAVAAVAGIILLSLLCMMAVRARRRQPLLPGPNGGFIRINRPLQTQTVPTVNYDYNNASAYRNESAYQQQGQGQYRPPAGAPADQPPPPYPNKETYPGQQSQTTAAAAPQPGGFAPPPGPPPAAHINDTNPGNNRFGWFKANQ